jgi:hypothetical protein
MADQPMELNEAMRELAVSGKFAKKTLRAFVAVESVFESAQQAQETVAALERRKSELEHAVRDLEVSRDKLVTQSQEQQAKIAQELAAVQTSSAERKEMLQGEITMLEQAWALARDHLETVTAELEGKTAAALQEKEAALQELETQHRGRVAAMLKEEGEINNRVEAAKRRLQQARQEIGA